MAHNRYQNLGGEDISTQADVSLLLKHGHLVELLETSNDRLNDMSCIRAFARTTWSIESYRQVHKKIIDFQPDIFHVQNYFPLFSPSIFHAAASLNVPVIQTLRNYRLLCPNGLFLRNGNICELCKTRYFAFPGIRYKCYRESYAATLAVAVMLTVHRKLKTWQHKVSRYITLTPFVKQKYLEAGFPERKFVIRPNFLDVDPGVGNCYAHRSGALFVSMLLPYKGAHVLIDAFNHLDRKLTLTIIGSGSEECRLRQLSAHNKSIRFFGEKKSIEIFNMLKQSQFLVFPSLVYENFPRVILEAFACGTPVIASRLGSTEFLIRDGETGLHFSPGNSVDLTNKIRWALSNPEEMTKMGLNAREEYKKKYTADVAYHKIVNIYSGQNFRLPKKHGAGS